MSIQGICFIRRVRVLCLLAVVCCCQRAAAQYDVAFNEFWALQSFYNPAASGINGLLDVH